MMIDLLAGLRAVGDRSFAAGPEARDSLSDETRAGEQGKVNNTEQSVNNRAASDEQTHKSPPDESFGETLSNTADEKQTKNEQPVLTRDARPAVGVFARLVGDETGRLGGETADVMRFLESLPEISVGAAIAPADVAGKPGGSEFLLGGALQTRLQELSALGPSLSGGRGAAGALALPEALETLVGRYLDRLREHVQPVDLPQVRTGALDASMKLQQNLPPWIQQTLQQAGISPTSLVALAGLADSFDLAPGEVEFSSAGDGSATSKQFNFAKLPSQANPFGAAVLPPSAFGAFGFSSAVLMHAVGDAHHALTEMGPVEFSAAKLHEAMAQTTAPLQQTAASSPAISAQLIAAFKADRIGNSIEVRLDPPELGRVRIDFAVETAEAVRAVVTAERAETLDYLRRNATHLANELRAAGFADVDLAFAEHGGAKTDAKTGEVVIDIDGDPVRAQTDQNMVYLTMRDNARLNMLV